LLVIPQRSEGICFSNYPRLHPAYCTITVTVPVRAMEPEVATTVMTYVPAVVMGVVKLVQVDPCGPLPPPLHPTTPPTKATNNNAKPRIDRRVRLRFGRTKRNKLARATPLPARHGIPLGV
jgi:hypothetical protein